MIVNRETYADVRRQYFLIKSKDTRIQSFDSTMVLYRHKNIINREAIDVFFAGRLVPSKRSEVAGVGRQKGLRLSVIVCG